MDEKVVIEIELDDDSIKDGLSDVGKESARAGRIAGKNLETNIQSGLKRGGELGARALRVAALGAASAVALGIGAAFASRRFIQAASIQEDAVNSLNSSLIATGRFTEQASTDFQQFASSLQQTTRFGDEIILQNAALIQSLGNLSGQGLQDATRAATDLSAALGIDLRTASNLVGRAATGNIELFSRYGVTIQKGANNAETFSNALTALNRQFGGAAARDVLTFSGTIEQLGNTVGDTAEDIGFLITRTPEVTAFAKAFEQSFTILRGIIADNADEIRAFIGGALTGLRNGFLITVGAVQSFIRSIRDSESFQFFASVISQISDFIRSNFVPAIGLIGNVFDVVVGGLKTGFSAILTGFLSLAQGANNILSAVGINTGFTENLDALAEGSREAFGGFVNETSQSLDNLLSPDRFENQGQQFLSSFGSFIEEAKTLSSDSETGESVFEKILAPFSEENINSSIANVGKLGTGLSAGLKKITTSITGTAKQASFDLGTRLSSAIAGGIQNVTQSLISGENIFSNFAKFVLGTFGDLAIQLGQFFLIQGFAVEALKGINGLGAIAAGAGLIALGTLLKSFSGGSSAIGSSGSSPAGSIGTPSDTGAGVTPNNEDLSTDPDAVDEGSRTNVNLTVNGDIFDSRDTSRRIATLLTEAFDDEDITINDGAFA